MWRSLIRWLWPLKPSKVQQLRLDMANRRLTWMLPPVTSQQHPIAGVEIAFRVDASVPWTVQTIVPAAETQELLFMDVPPGEMFYRAVIIDVVGARGNDNIISASGTFDLPGSVTNFIATEE